MELGNKMDDFLNDIELNESPKGWFERLFFNVVVLLFCLAHVPCPWTMKETKSVFLLGNPLAENFTQDEGSNVGGHFGILDFFWMGSTKICGVALPRDGGLAAWVATATMRLLDDGRCNTQLSMNKVSSPNL
jgi:hypothetical protein